MDCESGVDSWVKNGSYTPINTRITKDNLLENLQKFGIIRLEFSTSGSFDFV